MVNTKSSLFSNNYGLIMNYKIMFSVIFVLLAVTVIFAYSMELYIQIYDPNWYGIINSNKSMNNTKDKIFIIGSSNVYAINATKINEQMSNAHKNYLVYNLADMSDTPERRLNSIDNIISHKPELVLYGIGVWEFQKFKSEFKTNSVIDFLLEPRDFFKYLFEDTTDLSLREQVPSSPKDRSLTLLKYILRGPDHHYHPFIKFVPTPINSYEKIIEDFGIPESHGLDVTDQSKKIIALNQILHEFQKNDVKVILFSNPQHEIVINSIQNKDLKNFQEMLNNISNEFGIPVYFMHDKYIKSDIWRESFHIAIDPDSTIYTDDISKIILREINQ